MTVEPGVRVAQASRRVPHLRSAITYVLVALALVALALAISALSVPALLVASGSVALAAQVLFWPQGVLYALLVSVPFGSLAEVDAGDFAISVTEALVAALMVSWLLAAAVRRSLPIQGGPMLVALLWVLAIMLVGLPSAPQFSLAVKESVKWLETIAVFLFVAVHLRRAVVIQRVLAVMLTAGVAQALYGLYQVTLGEVPESFAVGEAVRAFGSFDQPNPFAGYLATLLPLGAVLAVTLRRWHWQALTLFGMAIVGLAILASYSRGAWLGLAVAALVVLAAWSRHSRRLLLPLGYAAVVLVVLGLLGLLPGAAVERVSVAAEYFRPFDVRGVAPTPENWAVVERMAHWQAGWYMFRDHPLLGVGAGNYPAAYDHYFLPGWEDPLGHAHNYYINVAAELGLLGLLGVVALLGLAFRHAARGASAATASHEGWFWRVLGMGLIASLLVFAVHNVFDNLLVHGMSVQLGLILGLVYVVGARGRVADTRSSGDGG